MHTIYPVILPVSPDAKTMHGRSMVRHLSGLARLAVTLSADKSGRMICRFPKNDNGVPQPENGIYWSATHKRDYVAGVAAVLPVGIDIEKIKDVRNGMYAKAADDAEWSLFGTKVPDTFFRCWTAKEAVLKIGGTGLKDLLACRIASIRDDVSLTVFYQGRQWGVYQYRCGDYLAAVACGEARVEWTRIVSMAAGGNPKWVGRQET